MATGLLMLAMFTVCYTLLAKTLSNGILTAPILFIGFGYFMAQTGLMPLAEAEHLLHIVAELALIILLFLDAAQINLQALRQRHQWPLRMLVIGLPLAIVIGTAAAAPFRPRARRSSAAASRSPSSSATLARQRSQPSTWERAGSSPAPAATASSAIWSGQLIGCRRSPARCRASARSGASGSAT